jgi:mercuric ion binding protein
VFSGFKKYGLLLHSVNDAARSASHVLFLFQKHNIMKSLFSFLLAFACLFIASASFAQAKKETFKVAGECGMCQKKIEGAAKKAGASFASWNTDSKLLTVRYNASSSNTAKIQRSIAAVGYDTPGFKASDAAYNSLHDCCKYDRAGATAAASCCDSDKCKETACMKDGKCAPDMSCCKESECSTKACCKKS